MFVILLLAHVSQSMKQIFEFFQIPQTEALNVDVCLVILYQSIGLDPTLCSINLYLTFLISIPTYVPQISIYKLENSSSPLEQSVLIEHTLYLTFRHLP